MAEKTVEKKHDLTIVCRKKLTLTGVEDVRSYDDNRIVMLTALGGLVVAGSGLKLVGLDTASGNAEIEGVVKALEYTESGAEKGFFKRLFR
ncbi:MAG: sporulation protein YabP [Clostridia bacterium]|nr:sporulation protein YabP [Clostridia bacterium]MBR5768757.1 sporulation protein YabP [Clostridia bacterium]